MMKDNKDYVQRNIKMINDFYNSDYYHSLEVAGEKKLIKVIIDAIYIDPDRYDMHIYENLSEKLNLTVDKCQLYKNKEIILSADAVCGWKQLYDIWNGNVKWVDDYEKIRTCTAAYLVWPRHKTPTINTLRYSIFSDRVDCTLFDISKFYDCKKNFSEKENQKKFKDNVKETCKLYKAYLNPNGTTYDWLMTFDGFKDFIDKMHLERFVDISTYNVLNIEDNNGSYITDKNEIYSFNDIYLQQLKKIIKYNNDSKK